MGSEMCIRDRLQDMVKNGFTSLIMFYPMGVEGERLKDQEVKKVVDVWGVRVKEMFYDQEFQYLVAVVNELFFGLYLCWIV